MARIFIRKVRKDGTIRLGNKIWSTAGKWKKLVGKKFAFSLYPSGDVVCLWGTEEHYRNPEDDDAYNRDVETTTEKVDGKCLLDCYWWGEVNTHDNST